MAFWSHPRKSVHSAVHAFIYQRTQLEKFPKPFLSARPLQLSAARPIATPTKPVASSLEDDDSDDSQSSVEVERFKKRWSKGHCNVQNSTATISFRCGWSQEARVRNVRWRYGPFGRGNGGIDVTSEGMRNGPSCQCGAACIYDVKDYFPQLLAFEDGVQWTD